ERKASPWCFPSFTNMSNQFIRSFGVEPIPHAINDYEFPSFWGIGWAIVYVDGRKILNHDGGIDGQNAFALIFPNQGFGIFIMTNHRSMYKNLMAEYAENIFLKNQFQRDYEKEKEFLSMKP
ncbi:MAG: hypothetical protein AAFR66_25330, partial [Bacteroidota bacterium]